MGEDDLSSKFSEKEGQVDLNLNQRFVFKGLIASVVILFFVFIPGIGFILTYFSAGYLIAKWVLPEEKASAAKMFGLSVFGPLSWIPVLFLKNYYDYMHIEENSDS